MSGIPQIRFKGVTHDWEQRKFGEFAQRQSNTMVSDSENSCVEYEDVIFEQSNFNKELYSKNTDKKGLSLKRQKTLYNFTEKEIFIKYGFT